MGVLLGLDEVLDGDETGEAPLGIDQGQLLDAVLSQERLGVLPRDAGLAGDEAITRRHALAHGQARPALRGDEAQVAVGDDPLKVASRINDGQAGNLVVAAELVELGDGGIRPDGHRVGDHAGLRALDASHLLGLVLDGQVAVKDADTTLASHGNGHVRLGDRVHRGREQRGGQADPRGQSGGRIDLGGDDVGQPGQQEHVVVSESGGGKDVRAGDRVAHGTIVGRPDHPVHIRQHRPVHPTSHRHRPPTPKRPAEQSRPLAEVTSVPEIKQQ